MDRLQTFNISPTNRKAVMLMEYPWLGDQVLVLFACKRYTCYLHAVVIFRALKSLSVTAYWPKINKNYLLHSDLCLLWPSSSSTVTFYGTKLVNIRQVGYSYFKSSSSCHYQRPIIISIIVIIIIIIFVINVIWIVIFVPIAIITSSWSFASLLSRHHLYFNHHRLHHHHHRHHHQNHPYHYRHLLIMR